jgi:hypothetical protein
MTEKTNRKAEQNEIDFMPLSEAAKLSGYTPEYLNLRARQGKLQAKKIGRNWHTKKEWLDEFLGSKVEEEKAGEEEKVETDRVEEVKGVEEGKVFAEPGKKEISLTHQNSWLKIFAGLASAVIILPLMFVGMYIFRNVMNNSRTNSALMNLAKEDQKLGSGIVNENSVVGEVAAAATTGNPVALATGNNGVTLASENYKIADINIGGGVMILANQSNVPLVVSNIHSESFLTGKQGSEVNLVVSWSTNKEALSEIDYSKNGGVNPKTARENSYGFNHSVVLSGLTPGTSYVYQIKAADRWGNEVSSDRFGVYTASQPVSVFDLISNAVGQTFGWAIKK